MLWEARENLEFEDLERDGWLVDEMLYTWDSSLFIYLMSMRSTHRSGISGLNDSESFT